MCVDGLCLWASPDGDHQHSTFKDLKFSFTWPVNNERINRRLAPKGAFAHYRPVKGKLREGKDGRFQERKKALLGLGKRL